MRDGFRHGRELPFYEMSKLVVVIFPLRGFYLSEQLRSRNVPVHHLEDAA